mmetsp:Transcript_59702/g.81604  ORF Transcript_59702/g.81604 Transcript_59702/m.81604 type:complete len:241 (-) Transcript_59702:573-1295(-)|eukprot:CAMPEP_0185773442 /NCGR_PEP_ID=MMETSP1174-20130828/73592_1 /TAXON_ID=35687 /ORGANISM="Dictyocha speculum, Strain CCMP1381" /LENGTH=240 /DNA_ID=CAMNT_0028460133 /DNA_START=87 /DNA_END=809 /DNA_ORIENTATION=-
MGPKSANAAAYSAPFILLALAVTLVMVNVKHSMLCGVGGGESPAEAALNRQALEKRLLALEEETIQNNILFESFVRRLDEQYHITDGVSLGDMKSSAKMAAMSISARLSEEAAPPMPSFASLYEDPTKLADDINRAMENLDDYAYGYKGENAQMDDFAAFSGEQEAKLVDDVYGWQNAEPEADFSAEEPAIPEAEAKIQCSDWKQEYGVTPGISWGSLPYDMQNQWRIYDCDKHTSDAYY